MITDRENMFSDNQAVTVDGNATDVVKVTNRARNTRMRLYWQVRTNFNNLTSLKGTFVASAAANLSSPRTLLDSGAIALATLNAAAGYRFEGEMPDLLKTELYVGLIWDVVGTAPTLGNVDAGMAEAIETSVANQPTYFTGL